MPEIPAFHFTRGNEAQPSVAREFVAGLISTRRFWRTVKSQVLFEVGPRDYCTIERWQGLASVLEDGQVMRLTGDIDPHAYQCMWVWLTAHKWRLPRADGASRPVNA